MTERKIYSKEFKIEALRLLELGETKGSNIARDLGDELVVTFRINGVEHAVEKGTPKV